MMSAPVCLSFVHLLRSTRIVLPWVAMVASVSVVLLVGPTLVPSPAHADSQPEPTNRPDLSAASTEEQAAIERACSGLKNYGGPSAYYGCLRQQVAALRATPTRPDLSAASTEEQAAIERAC